MSDTSNPETERKARWIETLIAARDDARAKVARIEAILGALPSHDLVALDWVADNLHAEGDAGDALRERLGLTFIPDWTGRRLIGPWKPLP